MGHRPVSYLASLFPAFCLHSKLLFCFPSQFPQDILLIIWEEAKSTYVHLAVRWRTGREEGGNVVICSLASFSLLSHFFTFACAVG
jgi:hypothetical protein